MEARERREERWALISQGCGKECVRVVLMPSGCGELLAIQRNLGLNRLTQMLKAHMPLIRLPKWLIPAAPWEGKSLSG